MTKYGFEKITKLIKVIRLKPIFVSKVIRLLKQTAMKNTISNFTITPQLLIVIQFVLFFISMAISDFLLIQIDLNKSF